MPGPDTPPPTDQFGPDKPPLADEPIRQSAPPPSTPADPLDPPAKITWLHPDSQVPPGQPSFGYTPPLVVVDEPAVPPGEISWLNPDAKPGGGLAESPAPYDGTPPAETEEIVPSLPKDGVLPDGSPAERPRWPRPPVEAAKPGPKPIKKEKGYRPPVRIPPRAGAGLALGAGALLAIIGWPWLAPGSRPDGPGSSETRPRQFDVPAGAIAGAAGGRIAGLSSGDPHLITLDGLHYDFQAGGEFLLAQSSDGAFAIQVRQRRYRSAPVSINRAVAARVGDHRAGVYATKDGPLLRVDGAIVRESRVNLSGGGRIEALADGWRLTWPDGSTLEVQGGTWLDLAVTVAPALRGDLSGLLGNADGDPSNDLVTHDGRRRDPAKLDVDFLYREFGASWRVAAGASFFDFDPGDPADLETGNPDGYVGADSLDAATRQRAEATCRAAGVKNEPFLADCILDVGLSGDPAFAESGAWAAGLLASGGNEVAPSNDGPSPSTAPSSTAPSSTAPSSGAPLSLGPDSWDELVASIDRGIRESSVDAKWEVSFRLLDFTSVGTDYRPYLAIGSDEKWTWTVERKCANGPCDVRFDAFNARLGQTYPSGLRWDASKGTYYSIGVTAEPAAFCKNANGSRIPGSYEVEQTLFLVPRSTNAGTSGPIATELIGVRVDKGRPATGMPASCGTFTEVWGFHAVRPRG